MVNKQQIYGLSGISSYLTLKSSVIVNSNYFS